MHTVTSPNEYLICFMENIMICGEIMLVCNIFLGIFCEKSSQHPKYGLELRKIQNDYLMTENDWVTRTICFQTRHEVKLRISSISWSIMELYAIAWFLYWKSLKSLQHDWFETCSLKSPNCNAVQNHSSLVVQCDTWKI